MKLYCFLKNKIDKKDDHGAILYRLEKERRPPMVIRVPEKLYTMEKKYSIIKENSKIYQKGRKKLKTQILDELERILGMNRQYLSFLLRVGCQDFCVWLVSFPNLKLNNCLISYSFPFKLRVFFP